MNKFDESEGKWRTIRGRRVFIAKGESLGQAMAKSGKFKREDIRTARSGISMEDRFKRSENKSLEKRKKEINKMRSKDTRYSNSVYSPISRQDDEKRKIVKGTGNRYDVVENKEDYDRKQEDESAERIYRKLESSRTRKIAFNEKELKDKLLNAIENENATKEDVKRIISEYKNKKISNTLKAKDTGTSELSRLENERYNLEQEIDSLSSGNYAYSDDKDGILYKHHDNMTSSERNDLANKRQRIYDIEERQAKIMKNTPRKAISNNKVQDDIIAPFKTEDNFVKKLDSIRVGNEDIYNTAERFVRSGNYLDNYEDMREYMARKYNYREKVSDRNIYASYVQKMTQEMVKLYNRNKKGK